MIKDDFRRGSGLPSSDWHNAVARAANQVTDLKKSSHNHVATNNNVLSGQVAIHIKNCTRKFLPRLSVVSVCYPTGQDGGTGRIAEHPVRINNFVLNQGIIYEGWVPTDTTDTWTPAITLSDLHPGEISKAVIMGIVTCLVDIQSDTHGFADIIPGNTDMLQSVEKGKIRIIKQSLPRDRNPYGTQPVDVLLGFGEGGGTPPQRIRIVQPKELFPACEYKTLQDVHGCTLEYSDDNTDWTVADTFDIVGGRMEHTFDNPDPEMEPHRYWRVNLKGFALPENPAAPDADRGFSAFGRLWKAQFWVERKVETKMSVDETEYTFTADIPDNLLVNHRESLPVAISLAPPVPALNVFYRPQNETNQRQWGFPGGSIPAAVIRNNTFFQFEAVSAIGSGDILVGRLTLRRPTYKLSPSDASLAMLPPEEEEPTDVRLPWDSKPVPRNSSNHRIWQLTFDQPEIVTSVILDVDQHAEHDIVCPGGRDANGNAISFIYAFDLTTEKWTATTFPEMRVPMFNMDAKIAKLADNTHNLVVLSGQTTHNHFSGTIQGYNFEKNQIQEGGGSGLSFAGRPALWDEEDEYHRMHGNQLNAGRRSRGRIILLGGSNRSTDIWTTAVLTSHSTHYTSTFALNPADFILSHVHHTTIQGSTTTISSGVISSFSTTWSVTFVTSGAGIVGNVVEEELRYTRHQNLPVRGFRRRRPVGSDHFPTSFGATPVVDFILIGGFNSVNNAQHNRSVVSGMLGGDVTPDTLKTTWSIPDFFHTTHRRNRHHFIYYPDTQHVLGDCCAEYIEERDEIICFGGRATEADTAVAHATPAVLEFSQTDNSATWNYTKYPQQPNPRWSAASVLIRGLRRKGETAAHDRIFIIGGRNRDGFVAEVDVFNLTTDTWETDWPGLDQGELEIIPPSMGGGGGITIIINGGAALVWE